MTLTSSQNRYLRGLAQQTRAVVLLGTKGATAAVVKELDLALEHHELVKVKLSGGDKAERLTQVAALTAGTRAEAVHQLGHTVLLFRRNVDAPKIALPR
ncbi:MAG: YhbY family RNA-binding protein [Xanthomonadales bacterium]|nr:YhbY family RNA-binding protein [Xanthomonadales bacterium]